MTDEAEPRKRVSTLRCPCCQAKGIDSFLSFQKWYNHHIRWTCEACGYVRESRNLNGHGGDDPGEVTP